MYIKNGEAHIEGFFEKSIWRDDRTGASIFSMSIRDEPLFPCGQVKLYDPFEKTEVTRYSLHCKANSNIPLFDAGTPIKAIGTFLKNGDFKVSHVYEAGNATAYAHYISRRFAIPGERAKKIIDELGGDLLHVDMRPDAERLFIETGFTTPRKAMVISDTLAADANKNRQIQELGKIGLPYVTAKHAIKTFSDDAYRLLTDNPWINGVKLGMTLKQCDYIADMAGIDIANSDRFEAMFMKVVSDVSQAGHTWQDADIFKMLCEKYSGREEPRVNEFISKSQTVREERESKRILFKNLIDTEKRIAIHVRALNSNQMPNFLCGMAPNGSVKYSDRQKEAFRLVETSGVKLLTGGPGTGKTTVTKGIVEYYVRNASHPTVKLAAPTGRAAQRLSESVGLPAVTVHQLLNYRPDDSDEAVVYCRDHRNPIDANLIVIDEMSMMNIEMMDLLTDAVKLGTTLLLVGDPEQLEPIGPGAVLTDLIASGVCEHIHLSEVFRQGEGSLIVENARRIADSNTELLVGDEFQIVSVDDEEDAAREINRLVRINHNGSDPFACQVLCPAKKSAAGVDNLNKELKSLLNPNPAGLRLQYGNSTFSQNDKVLTTVNNYAAGYFNGDIGTVQYVKEDGLSLLMRNEEFEVCRDNLNETSLAYAMTVHKAQGSEFKKVIISMPKDVPNMLVKTLFYTAVTRAKEKVIIVSVEDAMNMAICQESPIRRTCLADFLREGT